MHAITLALALAAGPWGFDGTGVAKTEARDPGAFHAVMADGTLAISFEVGARPTVVVTADDNLVALVKTTVTDGVLHVQVARDVSPHTAIRVAIKAPSLDRLEVDGAVEVEARGLKEKSLAVKGGGAVKIALAGSVDRLTVQLDGAGQLAAEGLRARVADVALAGAARGAVTVSDELVAGASGAAQLTYAGKPRKIIRKATGVGSIAPR